MAFRSSCSRLDRFIGAVVVVLCVSSLAFPQDVKPKPQPSQSTGKNGPVKDVPGQEPPKQASPQMKMGVLALASDSDGVLFVDGERKLTITPDNIEKLQLTAGQHFVDLRDSKGTRVWEKVIDVPPGTQVAERIGIKTASVPTTTQKVDAIADLTPCEWNSLFRKHQDAFTACEKEGVRQRLATMQAKSAVESAQKALAENCPTSARLEIDFARTKALDTRSCAAVSYSLGDYEKALAEVGPQIDAMKQRYESNEAFHKKTGIYQSAFVGLPDRLGAGQAADAYSLRAIIRYALSDTAGALADLKNAIDYIGLWRQEGDFKRALADTAREHLYNTYLYRAAILYQLGKYQDAIADLNEFAAMGEWGKPFFKSATGEDKKLRMLVEQALNGTTVHATTQPEPTSGYANSSNSIKTQIEDVIKTGRYTSLPTPTRNRTVSVPNGSALIDIKNDTPYRLTVLVSGLADRQIEVAPSSSTSLNLVTGTYKVVGRVAAASVLPSYGEYSFSGALDLSFHIQ